MKLRQAIKIMRRPNLNHKFASSLQALETCRHHAYAHGLIPDDLIYKAGSRRSK